MLILSDTIRKIEILFYKEESIMRGVETRIQEIRHKIFTEVARMAYHTEWPVKDRMEALPYKIIPGEKGNFRNDVFLERAIVGERLRLAMGLPYRSAAEHSPISDGIEAADKDETYYTPPLINVIKFACNACPEKRVHVTDGCQGCLAHPCMEVCPKDAISLDRTTGKSIIDQEKCIKCGRCASVCSYNAIIVQERPCAKACGMDAISSDENGKANIDYDKCVSCGQCLVNCPFGDLAFVKEVMSIDPELKLNKSGKGKFLLRKAFEKDELIPDAILWREKAAFSDAVGHSMVDQLKAYAEKLYTEDDLNCAFMKYPNNTPFTKEALWYRDVFESYFPNHSHLITDFWMPNKEWVGSDVKDPSARVLSNYGDSGK